MRFAKVLRFNKTRTDVGIDLNNLLNTNYATGFNTTYVYGTDNLPGPSGWGTPTSLYTARFVRFNLTVTFSSASICKWARSSNPRPNSSVGPRTGGAGFLAVFPPD